MRFSDIRVGYIYNVIFDPVRDCEFDGKHLALVLKKNNDGKTFIVMPLTSAANGSGVNKFHVGSLPCLPSSLRNNNTYALGIRNPDELDVTISSLMLKAINEERFDWKEGIISTKEGICLVPSNLDLSGVEMNLVGTMNREQALRQYVDKVKNHFDFVLIDCLPTLGMLTINALSAADSVIIPVQAHYLPAKGMKELMKTIGMVASLQLIQLFLRLNVTCRKL